MRAENSANVHCEGHILVNEGRAIVLRYVIHQGIDAPAAIAFVAFHAVTSGRWFVGAFVTSCVPGRELDAGTA